MAIVFNADGFSDIEMPCVAQTFINHDAVMYKIFVVGRNYSIVERPSLKNFVAAGMWVRGDGISVCKTITYFLSMVS